MPGTSTGWKTWKAIQSRKAWMWRLVNSCLTTSTADSWRRRAQILPRGCSASMASSDGPKPTGVNCDRLKMDLTCVVFVQQPAVGDRVGGGEARHLLDRALAVQPHGELLTVGERDLLHRVGLGVASP